MVEKKLDSLLEYARANGMSEADVVALHKMLWKIWAHPNLIGFRLVAESLRQIGLLTAAMWKEQLPLFEMERWPFLLEWLGSRKPSIWSVIGIDKETGKNPMKQHGFEANAIYSALCQTHTVELYQRDYRLLQGHILFAFSLALGKLSSLDKYREMCHAIRDSSDQQSEEEREAIREPLPSTPCYLVGYALRRLGSDERSWMALLGLLDVNRTPSSFAAWIDTFVLPKGIVKSAEARDDFRVIRNFLVGVYKHQCKDVARLAGGIRENTTRDSIHGTVEFGFWGTVFTQTADESLDQDDEFYYFINPLCTDDLGQTQNSPHDSEDTQEILVIKSSNHGPPRDPGWKQNYRKMMANQFLPFNYGELNSSQLGLLWSGLDKWWRKVKPGENFSYALSEKDMEKLEIGALLWVMLWTVSPISRAMRLDVLIDPDQKDPNEKDPDEEVTSPLSLIVTHDENGEEIRRWRIKSLPPKINIDCPDSHSWVDHILLPDICGGAAWVLALRERQGKGLPIFSEPKDEYQKRIARLLREFRDKNCIADPITASRFSKVLFWRLLRQSGHDFSAVSLITGQDHPLNISRRHYTTRLVADMQKLYVKCADDLAGEIASVWGIQFHPINFPTETSGRKLGARHCPALKTVREAVNTLRESVKVTLLLQFPKSAEEFGMFADQHNHWTLYVYWMFAFATGIRGIVDPYPHIETVDEQTGIYSIEDKKANSGEIGYKRRLVHVPPVLFKQMNAYGTYLKRLKRDLPIHSKKPCFFLDVEDSQLRPVTIRPVELESRVEKLLPFPVNTQRLFLRSELLGRGCDAEIVDAFMGHWAFGEEPWAPYSTFNYAVYFATLKPYIADLLKDLKFEVVCKRIVDR